MGKTIIELKDICKSYGMPDDELVSTAVLKELSLTVDEGDALAITGPSGSGKSTLLNIIGTLDKADSGQIELAGNNIVGLSEEELAALRLRDIGFVFQLHHLLPQCTVLENVLLPTLPANAATPPAEASERAQNLLSKMGLADRIHHRPAQLSGGERQRVAVARALINQPGILLADEPTGSLDQKAAEELAQLLINLNREENVTLVVVTHSPVLAAHMDKELKLQDGILS